jgi:hypothetical protein
VPVVTIWPGQITAASERQHSPVCNTAIVSNYREFLNLFNWTWALSVQGRKCLRTASCFFLSLLEHKRHKKAPQAPLLQFWAQELSVNTGARTMYQTIIPSTIFHYVTYSYTIWWSPSVQLPRDASHCLYFVLVRFLLLFRVKLIFFLSWAHVGRDEFGSTPWANLNCSECLSAPKYFYSLT